MSHQPVMLGEVVSYLRPADGEIYVDGTFGAGGYTRAFLEAADCRVIAIDQDPTTHARAQDMARDFGPRFTFCPGQFADAKACLNESGAGMVDGFVLDLGVSSMQLDRAERGFSFRFDGPLDMRMNQNEGQSAADLVNTMPEEDLANVIYLYGQERHSRRIARRIAQRRQDAPLRTTRELAELVRGVVPFSKKDGSDPATRTFQALRIAVNDELGQLERGLQVALDSLRPGGRVVIVTFHSLEDAIVKKFFRDHAQGQARGSRHLPVTQASGTEGVIELLTRKAVAASPAEIAVNPRARSAKLRAAIKKGEAA